MSNVKETHSAWHSTFLPDVERNAIKKALLRYCELDTLAMVILYEFLSTANGEV